LSQKIVRMAFPFSVQSENRTEPFTSNMEKAAIYCFAELEREKGGGLILKKPEEKQVFLTKFCYPLWLTPWNGLNLVFDGFKTRAYTLTCKTVPDVKTFNENLQRSSKALETYTAFLSDNINYFQLIGKEKAITIDALITEPDFLNELGMYLSEAKQIESPPPEIVLLPPTIDEPTILSMIQDLEKIKLEFQEEVGLLYDSMKLLKKATRNFVKTIRSEIKQVMDEFDEEIKKQEKIITPKINNINEEYDEKITQLTKNFEGQLLLLQKEKTKAEKIKEQIISKIERCKIEAQACADKKDSVGEREWKEKISEGKKELSEIEDKIEELEEKIKEIEENKAVETFKLKSELETKIKEAKKDLLELEASRDTKVRIHNQEIEKLESSTSAIIQSIDNVAKLRETELRNFEKLGIPQKHKNPTLVYVPFYLACYQIESKRRYILFPPSLVNSIGFSAKLKGALGKPKIKQLLTSRFKALNSLLNKLPSLIKQDTVFEREITEEGEKVGILHTKSRREQVKNGLEQLKAEGWFSEKEYEALIQKLT